MPIKGLTDRGLAFPEIGQIRKGAKKTGNAPGRDLDYFRVEFDEMEAKAREAFRSAYGDKPTAIRIILPFNEIERMWDAWLEAYTAGRMVARSDGETVQYACDGNTGQITVKNGVDVRTGLPVPHPKDNIAGYDYKNKAVEYKHSGRLKVIVPELARAAYLTVMTTSVHDIQNISAQLSAFQIINNGQLAGIPFILSRKPKKISIPMNGKRVRMAKWLISIEADPDWVKGKLLSLKHAALPDNGLAALPDPERHEEEPTDLPVSYDDDELEDETVEGETTTEEPVQVRPYDAKTVKQKVTDLALSFSDDETLNMPNVRRQVLASVLNTTLEDKTKRYELCEWLTGTASVKEMEAGYVLAMLKWQGVSNFNQMPSDEVKQETHVCHSAALVAKGQLELTA